MQFKKGYEEDSFLKMLNLPAREMEFMAENCTKVYKNYYIFLHLKHEVFYVYTWVLKLLLFQ